MSDEAVKLPKSFPASTCQRIRNLVKFLDELEAKRKELFDARDDAEARRAEAELGSADRAEAEREYGESCLEIKRWKKALKNADNNLRELIRKADKAVEPSEIQLTLADFIPPAVKPKPPEPTQPAEKAPELKLSRDPEIPEGVNQHAAASINELELSSEIVRALLPRGFNTVASLIAVIDAGTLADQTGLGEVPAGLVEKAVARYRKKHLKASIEVEREAVGV